MNNYHVKKGDKVLVNAGHYKGEEATILAVLSAKDRVVLELSSKKVREIGKKTVKKSKLHPNGGLVERSVSVQVSNVTLTEESKKAKQEAKAARREAKAAARAAKKTE